MKVQNIPRPPLELPPALPQSNRSAPHTEAAGTHVQAVQGLGPAERQGLRVLGPSSAPHLREPRTRGDAAPTALPYTRLGLRGPASLTADWAASRYTSACTRTHTHTQARTHTDARTPSSRQAPSRLSSLLTGFLRCLRLSPPTACVSPTSGPASCSGSPPPKEASSGRTRIEKEVRVRAAECYSTTVRLRNARPWQT